ncbi:MAG: hypothetical protein Q8K98_14610 [Bacteroidota bacterium]|nr:hypothetical protein [Bacteroidota bacterium]
MKTFSIFLTVLLCASLIPMPGSTAWGPAFAQTSAGERQTRPSNEERLTRVDEGVKNLGKRFDDMNRRIDGLEISLNKRIDGLETSLNRRIDGLEISFNKRIDDLRSDMNSRFDDIKNFMYWGFGIIFGWVAILMGFILWDRRSTLAPVVREQKYIQAEIDEWKKKEKIIIEVLNKYAENDPKLKEIINKAALF